MSRTLYDIAQLLESADGADERVRRVLELLRALVPYDQCAMLKAGFGYEPHVVMVPDVPPAEGGPLLGTLLDLFGQLVDTKRHVPASAPRLLGGHLAVPLVGLDEVIGLLFVRSSTGGYTEDHLRALSVVAAKLAAYFTTLRGRAEISGLARERDDARRAAQATRQANDDLLALLSGEVKVSLGSMLGLTGILRSTTDGATARAQALDDLERAVQAQATLIDGVLGQAGIASAAPRPSTVDLSEPRADHHRLSGVRVLLVDHDLLLRESVEAVLDQHGAEVTSAGSAPEALAAFERSRPDVLLFGDLPAPGQSVYELMREVTARACPLPVASISAWRFEERQRERAAGFQLHLAKPLETEALVEAVAALAGRRRGSASPPQSLPPQERAPEGQALRDREG